MKTAEALTLTAAPPAEPPSKVLVAAGAEEPPCICPQSGQPCMERPTCVLADSTGRTMCVQWQAQVRREAIEARSR